MTTDPYRDTGSETFGPGGQAPVAPGYGISDPFPSSTTPTATGASALDAGAPTSGTSTGNETADTAKDEAGQVKDTAAGAASQVAGTAKQEAGNVVGEAKAQASNLLDQVKGEAGSQVGTQQQRLAGLAHSYSKELGSMASKSEESGPVTDLVHQASERVGSAGHWLENHEPADLLDEVRRFARRRPGTFLLGALAAGVVVGRLTRGAVDDARSDDTSGTASTTAQPAVDAGFPTGRPPVYDATGPAYAEPTAGYPGETQVPGAELADPLQDPAVTYGSTYGGTYDTPGQVR